MKKIVILFIGIFVSVLSSCDKDNSLKYDLRNSGNIAEAQSENGFLRYSGYVDNNYIYFANTAQHTKDDALLDDDDLFNSVDIIKYDLNNGGYETTEVELDSTYYYIDMVYGFPYIILYNDILKEFTYFDFINNVYFTMPSYYEYVEIISNELAV